VLHGVEELPVEGFVDDSVVTLARSCDMPPVAITPIRLASLRTTSPTAWPSKKQRRGVGSGGASVLMTIGTMGRFMAGVRKCSGIIVPWSRCIS